jgi:uncharacterized repeat protein (TIGR01451 family)
MAMTRVGMRSRLMGTIAAVASLLLPVAAFAQSAACTADEQQVTFNYATWVGGSTGPLGFPAGTGLGQVTLTTQFSADTYLSGTPLVSTTGNTSALVILVDHATTAATNTFSVSFNRAVTKLRLIASDIDTSGNGANNYQDQATVSGVDALGATVLPTLTATTPARVSVSGNVATAVAGAGTCTNTENLCDARADFTNPVLSFTVTYSNGAAVSGNPPQQLIGYHDFSFCVPTTGSVTHRKISDNGIGAFAYTNTNLSLPATAIVTTTAGTPVSSTASTIVAFGNAVGLTETPILGWTLTAASCTDSNGAVSGNTGTIGALAGTTLTIPAANAKAGANLICTFTNQAGADLGVTKNNSVSTLVAGSTTSYQLVVSNAGPGNAGGAVLGDPVTTGLSVTNVSCAAAGGGVCPGLLTVAALQGAGLVIPTLPPGATVTFTVTATVTATGQ